MLGPSVQPSVYAYTGKNNNNNYYNYYYSTTTLLLLEWDLLRAPGYYRRA